MSRPVSEDRSERAERFLRLRADGRTWAEIGRSQEPPMSRAGARQLVVRHLTDRGELHRLAGHPDQEKLPWGT